MVNKLDFVKAKIGIARVKAQSVAARIKSFSSLMKKVRLILPNRFSP